MDNMNKSLEELLFTKMLSFINNNIKNSVLSKSFYIWRKTTIVSR